MKRIIIKMSLFTANQKIFIEENGNLTKEIVPVDNISAFIACSNCDEVLIYGVPEYCKKWENDVQTKFKKDNIIWKYNNKDFLKETKFYIEGDTNVDISN